MTTAQRMGLNVWPFQKEALPESAVFPSFAYRIRARKNFNQYYIAFILHSEFLQMMLWRTVKYSTVRPNTTKPDVEDLMTPIISKKKMQSIGKLTHGYLLLRKCADDLIQEAKTDVEKLIEGKLDTQGIIAGRIKDPTWEEVEAQIKNEIEE